MRVWRIPTFAEARRIQPFSSVCKDELMLIRSPWLQVVGATPLGSCASSWERFRGRPARATQVDRKPRPQLARAGKREPAAVRARAVPPAARAETAAVVGRRRTTPEPTGRVRRAATA